LVWAQRSRQRKPTVIKSGVASLFPYKSFSVVCLITNNKLSWVLETVSRGRQHPSAIIWLYWSWHGSFVQNRYLPGLPPAGLQDALAGIQKWVVVQALEITRSKPDDASVG
jgi:hypothetical protein